MEIDASKLKESNINGDASIYCLTAKHNNITFMNMFEEFLYVFYSVVSFARIHLVRCK